MNITIASVLWGAGLEEHETADDCATYKQYRDDNFQEAKDFPSDFLTLSPLLLFKLTFLFDYINTKVGFERGVCACRCLGVTHGGA